MKLNVQHESEIDLDKRDVVCPKSEVQIATSRPVPVESKFRKFAERDEYQSGQRFLNGSALRLKRHVAFCETAAGDVVSPTAGKDQKPFREFEGRALISAEGAVPLSCFIKKRLIVTDDDPSAVQNLKMRSKPPDVYDKLIRKRGCGKWSVRGTSMDGSTLNFRRLNCKCWDCKYCGPRRAKGYRYAIASWAEKLNLNRLVTLTLDPKKLNGEDSTKYLNRTFGKLRSLLQREYGKSITFIRILEYQKNGTAHFHVLLSQYIDHTWLKAKWQAIGGGWHVDIRLVEIQRVVHYVSKYLSKELLLSAPKGARRVTTSRDIRLFEKLAKDTTWKLVKETITNLRDRFVAITETFCKTDGLLTAFTALANVA
jgi:hypothetical protein